MDGKNYRKYSSVAKLLQSINPLITVKIFDAYVLNVGLKPGGTLLAYTGLEKTIIALGTSSSQILQVIVYSLNDLDGRQVAWSLAHWPSGNKKWST